MLVPVVLSGGAGARLWPVSREGHPKPFMKLPDGESLLFKTYVRAAAVAKAAEVGSPEILTITNRDYYFNSKDEFGKIRGGQKASGFFMLEPSGRNTAPAVAMAAHRIAEKYGRDALLLILAADHLIEDQPSFASAVDCAVRLAREGRLVTFGVVPAGPETGFGYIEAGDALSLGGRAAVRFVEKPAVEQAREYIATGNFYWNSGMFCFSAGTLLDELKTHSPDVYAATLNCWEIAKANQQATDLMLEIPAAEFECAPDISLDYALMEHSDKVAVVPSDFGWSDIGSWNAVGQLVEPDEAGNRGVGDVIFVDSHNTFVQAEDRIVAALGVDNLMIIDTADALLVAHPDHAQDVKKVVARLKSLNHDSYRLHRTVTRPWGTYTVLEEGPGFKIKRIEVKPGGSLSLQMHHHRSEHWIVVKGMAKVVNGDREIFVSTNESTYIPAGHRHRLENPGLLDLVMIEVQSGEYLGEDDIVRFQDKYGRS